MRQPVGKVGSSGTMCAGNQTFYASMTSTRDEAAAYCDEIISAGTFNKESYPYCKDSGTKSQSLLLEAKSADGWEIGIKNNEIRIIKP